MISVKVSVPGKIILSGEHAVVYGKPAIAATVDKRLRITLQERWDNKQLVNSSYPDLSLVNKAIEKVVDRQLFLFKDSNKKYNGFDLKIESEIPVGAGMGSSAAVAVGVVAAFVVASTKDARLDYKKINDLAYKVEKIQHGTPSGIDNSTVIFGGFLWYRKEFEFLKTFWKLQFRVVEKLNNFYLVNTGKPEETTGEMVARVSEQVQSLKSKVQRLLNQIEMETKKMTRGLREENEQMLVDAIRGNERLLEELGVVGEPAKEIVRDIEKSGGVAKISGAGGVKDRSGLLFIYHKDKDAVKEIAKKHKLTYFPAKLGVEGLRIERIRV